MIRLAFLLAASVALAAPGAANAQAMGAMSMPGMKMPPPAKKPTAKPVRAKPVAHQAAPAVHKRALKPALKPQSQAPKRAPLHGMATMPGMDMSAPRSAAGADQSMPGMVMSAQKPASAPDHSMPGMDMSAGSAAPSAAPMAGMAMTGTALPAGNASAPPSPRDHYADRQFPAADISKARQAMMRESGGQTFSQIMFNLAEVQVRDGKDGYRWDGEGWFGGDINRALIKTEGEGTFREGVQSAEIQALYSRAIGPYFNLQAGVRHDVRPSPTRTYATIGFEGLAPYWFEVEGAVFLSTRGELLGRLGAYYDQRITQRLVLQPRIEVNLSAQDVPETRIGAGVSNAEFGLRLRYEFTRQFAPYIGVSYDTKTGTTADYARAEGKDPTSTSLVAGVRFWF